jgi:hypothetical protein
MSAPPAGLPGPPTPPARPDEARAGRAHWVAALALLAPGADFDAPAVGAARREAPAEARLAAAIAAAGVAGAALGLLLAVPGWPRQGWRPWQQPSWPASPGPSRRLAVWASAGFAGAPCLTVRSGSVRHLEP